MLSDKKALIVGLASNRSLAYGIAKSFHAHGCELAFTYLNERMEKRVRDLATKFSSNICLPCDVSKDSEIDNMFAEIAKTWGKFDILVHSVAFAAPEQFVGSYLDAASREGFNVAQEISSYSLTALAKAARPLMNENGSILTLTYAASDRVVPNYNVMGIAKASLEASVRYLAHSLGKNEIRVNAISAGPIKTLAASGIKNFRKMLAYNAENAPLKRNITIEQVGDTATFLCSNMASAITGEIIHVDNGFNIVAMPEEPNGEDKPK